MRMWQQWTTVVLGLIVAIVPFLALSAQAFTWTLLIAGIAVAALGVWGARETSDERHRGQMIERRT